MAMTVEGLTNAIYNKMAPLYFPGAMSEEDTRQIKQYYGAIASAVIEYFEENMEVLPGTLRVSQEAGSQGTIIGIGKVS